MPRFWNLRRDPRLIKKRRLAPHRKQVLIRRARKAATLCGFGLLATPVNIITTPFVTPLLLFRYIVLRKASEAPILYFRSFHYADGPTTLGKLILKIASRYGVVVCVVHESQKGSDLLRYARFASISLRLHLAKNGRDLGEMFNSPGSDVNPVDIHVPTKDRTQRRERWRQPAANLT